MKHTLSVLVENETGVLTRIAGLFARRGFNIESLSVGPAEHEDLSRITMVVPGDHSTIDQLSKQLYKLINVRKVQDVTHIPNVNRELMLLKVRLSPTTRSEILDIIKIFNARIVDFSEQHLIVEITGDTEKITSVQQLFSKFGIMEIAKTGKIALLRNVDYVHEMQYDL